ncbi:hypothetical protein [Streptomyces phytophilus]|uniref:hypothetical protein n=1 Tax=Streptomyces phytophilus TaxID=722715 RepID=UPI0015F109AC|nr:hypothetical protein [Streptomyces phytophilus]
MTQANDRPAAAAAWSIGDEVHDPVENRTGILTDISRAGDYTIRGGGHPKGEWVALQPDLLRAPEETPRR